LYHCFLRDIQAVRLRSLLITFSYHKTFILITYLQRQLCNSCKVIKEYRNVSDARRGDLKLVSEATPQLQDEKLRAESTKDSIAKDPNFKGGIKFNQRNLIQSAVCGAELAGTCSGLVTETIPPEKQLFSGCHVLCHDRLPTSASSTLWRSWIIIQPIRQPGTKNLQRKEKLK